MQFYENRTVLLTGATSGLGLSILETLAPIKGCRVVAGVRNTAKMNEICKSINRAGNIRVCHIDLENSDDVLRRDVEDAFQVFDGIDIVVNCAGVGFRGSVTDTTSETHRRIMQVDYFAQTVLTKTVLNLWETSGSLRGDIIQISSVQAFFGLGGRAPYSAAKHAMIGFIDSLRAEIDSYPRESCFRVMNVLPGYIATNHSTNALVGDGSTYEKSDPTTADGYQPSYVASELLLRASRGEREIIIAPFKVRLLITFRALAPSLCFRLIRNMYLGRRESLFSTIFGWLFNRS
jgi:dehydrogenase/reductase SDR family protein 7B